MMRLKSLMKLYREIAAVINTGYDNSVSMQGCESKLVVRGWFDVQKSSLFKQMRTVETTHQ